MLKKLLAKTTSESAPAKGIASVASSSIIASVYMEAVFCGLSPLGAQMDEETKDKIWKNKFVDIWSLVTIDQHTLDKKRRVYAECPADRKLWVTKTIGN